MKDFSFITNSHPSYIEGLYQDFVKNPDAVDPEFRKFFEGFDFAVAQGRSGPLNGANGTTTASSNGTAAASANGTYTPAKMTTTDGVDWKKELGAYRLILGYRNKGHLLAKTNPIRPRKDRGANLDLAFYGFTEEDLDKNFFAGNLIGLGTTTLRAILTHLQDCYADHVGISRRLNHDPAEQIRHWRAKRCISKLAARCVVERQLKIAVLCSSGCKRGIFFPRPGTGCHARIQWLEGISVES